jgi:predicted AAA+ superfamily ATPase
MAISNRERVGRAFELLATGLGPFVERQLRATDGAGGREWAEVERSTEPHFAERQSLRDPYQLLKVMAECWEQAFRSRLTRSDRNLVFELRDVRNRWAHNEAFSADDTYRALDSVERLLAAVDASEAAEVGRSKQELMRLRYESAARRASPGPEAVSTRPAAGLKPWREVVFPHDDVARGRYAVAEFAADLSQVVSGQGAAEYVDPVEFFRRTFLTAGLRQLLTEAAERLSGAAGIPVVDLQTNFGGGKTHSLIALYHLCCGLRPAELSDELAELLGAVGITKLPMVRRAVVKGIDLSPGQPAVKADGTVVRTLWGELAWQLGGRPGYELVAEADRTGTNPGQALRVLLREASPCLVLIDEWVAYARQLYGAAETLPGGSFDTHFSFAQALTEAARAVPGALLVVSIPASEPSEGGSTRGRVGSGGSELEVGGPGGWEALRRLRNVVGRMESSWRPASAEESFEIVRRRLFKPIEADHLVDRDATSRVFSRLYQTQASEFPPGCGEVAYAKRIRDAYPIHPELFARLYEDWSTLDRFQRTRGVLRLMAGVIHALWAANDSSPLIMPGSLPLDDAAVGSEVTHHLEDNWKPVIDTDVDGPGSLPVTLDRDFPNLGRYSAARRVARTVFLGSAPTLHSANRGVDAARVRLGCVIPGETVATFGDALTRLSDRATYLYVDRDRYWYGLSPSVTRMAQDRTERFLIGGPDDVVGGEIVRRMRLDRDRGEFAYVHIAPSESGDVADDSEVRLVILPPDVTHVARSEESEALSVAGPLLERRGTAARVYRNMVVFLAADHRRAEELRRGVAEHLAWQSIHESAEDLELDPGQRRQAATKTVEADQTVGRRLGETYQWLLVPNQPDPTGPIGWEAIRVEGQGGLAARAARRLVDAGQLCTAYAPVLLRHELDGPLASLWDEGQISAGELWDVFARYPYLPRLATRQVLMDAVRRGPALLTWASDSFAVADAFVPPVGPYLGLVAGGLPDVVTSATLLVRPELASVQLAEDEAGVRAPARQGSIEHTAGDSPTVGSAAGEPPSATGAPSSTPDEGTGRPPGLRRFYGVVALDSERLMRDFDKVVREVVSHLVSLVDTQVEVTVEVRATTAASFPDGVVRTVSENAQVLHFDSHAFEESG